MTRRLVSRNPNVLTVGEAAAYLGVSRRSVYELLHFDPPLPSFLILGSRRFWKAEVDAWLLALPRGGVGTGKRGPKPVDLAQRKAS